MDLPRQLFERAAASPEAPWLFFRSGLDWRWRSHRHVADQVVRSVAALEATSPAQPTAVRLVQEPDAVAALVAALAAGRSPRLEPLGTDAPWLAECRGTLDVIETEFRSDPDASPTPSDAEGMRFSLQLARDSEHFAALVRPVLKGITIRPILYAGASLDMSRTAALAAWSLRVESPWALESQADAFAATALWTRPHLLLAGRGELEAVLPYVGRSERRQSRLRAVVLVDGAGDGALEAAVAERWGCPLLAWLPTRPAAPGR
ncbi:MAG: hypothetical protein AAGM22_09065 [Acidobacteriota bacterium]